MPTNIVIDPITRIEGHLRVEVTVEDGTVTDAWSSGTMFRGLELILKDRDPRDAWVFTQRICGVCTTVHALASVRAVEDALGIVVPDNARILRNLIEGAQFIQDHVIHFYHLHALDWVDVVNALEANPDSGDPLYGVWEKLGAFVASGQLGPFANAYWGHEQYRLTPYENLAAVAHYLEALTWQREFIKMHAMLGGKNPHPETYLVGGMAIPVDGDNSNPVAITPALIGDPENEDEQPGTMVQLVRDALDFVMTRYLPDVLLVAPHYLDWAGIGRYDDDSKKCGNNFLSYGDFPDAAGDPWLPQGVIWDGDSLDLSLDEIEEQIKEYTARSWYSGEDGRPPAEGQTFPNYTGLDIDGKYTWLKAPRFNEQPMEVGPLARVLVAYNKGHARITGLVQYVLDQLSVGPEALLSTLGRTAARCIETIAIAEQMETWLGELRTNIRDGDLAIHNGDLWDPSTWPQGSAEGWGMTEAPRGGLGHWVKIRNGKIEHYQMVVPTTWNASPRDAEGKRGPLEQALIGTPVADEQAPLEVLRTVHSFDPCIACAVHVVDAEDRELSRVEINTF